MILLEAAYDVKARVFDEDEVLRDRRGRFAKKPGDGSPAVPHTPAARRRSAPRKKPAAGGGVYTGPRFEMPADVDQAAVKDLRKRLSTRYPESWSFRHFAISVTNPHGRDNDPIADLAIRVGPTVASRVAWEQDNLTSLQRFVQLHRPEDPDEDPYADLPRVTAAEVRDAKAKATEQLRGDFAGKRVIVRATAGSLAGILADGRFKTQFETKTSGGGYVPEKRRDFEAMAFGLPRDTDPKVRPIYGALAMSGLQPVTRHAGDDHLNWYGDVQIVLKDSVRSRTTASVGDSLDQQVLPAPVDDPDWGAFNWAMHWGRGYEMDYQQERSHLYVEAQIHGGVTTDDIDEVIFEFRPSEALEAALAGRGIPWRVMREARD